MSSIKLYYVYVRFKWTNQKVANQSILNGALAIDIVNKSFSES